MLLILPVSVVRVPADTLCHAEVGWVWQVKSWSVLIEIHDEDIHHPPT